MNRPMKQICLFAILFLCATWAQAQFQLPTEGAPVRKIDTAIYIPGLMISANTYTNNLAFFCKRELELEKKTGVSMKFRLGSVDYVNTLEGKSQFMRLPQQVLPLPKSVKDVPHKL
jgi:hypothetical protein